MIFNQNPKELRNSFCAKMLTHLSCMGRKFTLHCEPGNIYLKLYLKDDEIHLETGPNITTVFVKTLDYIDKSRKI